MEWTDILHAGANLGKLKVIALEFLVDNKLLIRPSKNISEKILSKATINKWVSIA